MVVESEGMSTWKIGVGTCTYVKLGFGNKSRWLEVGGRGGCGITGVTTEGSSFIALYFNVFTYLIYY